MVKHTQTIRRLLPTNCLCAFDSFVGLALKGLIMSSVQLIFMEVDFSMPEKYEYMFI